jgi:hypothetical protein
MGNPVSVTIGVLAAANAANIVASNTPSGAGNLTLVTSPFVADVPRQVLVTFGVEASNRVITITGTNQIGLPISETLTIPSGGASTKATTQSFASVTAVTVFAAWSVAMSVGTNTFASSPWFVIDNARNPINIAFGFVSTSSGGYQLEETYDDPEITTGAVNYANQFASIEPASNVPPLVWADSNFGSAKTANFQMVLTTPFFAWRLTKTTVAGSVTAQAIQAGYTGA